MSDKKKLVIVKNSMNDKGSEAYLRQIRKQWRESFQEDINLITYCIDDQSVLEDVMMENQDGKFLLLNPTNLYIPMHMQSRNAEKDQTAMYVVDSIRRLYSTDFNKILVIGKGVVGKKIFEELCIKTGYMVAMCGSKPYLSEEFTGQFDVIVNAISYESGLELYVDCSTFFDVSGNYEKLYKAIPVEDNGVLKFAHIEPSIKNFVGMREIGRNTVWHMLNSVKGE